MLAVEADDWWLETCRKLEAAGENVTWAVFRRKFLRKYFPEDVRGKKEIEFLELKQGNMSVVEYAAKFTELAKFYPHYAEENAEFSKCIKFENGLRPKIKKAVGYQKIRVFADLIDNCWIYEEDNNAHTRLSVRRGVSTNRIVVSLTIPQLVKVNRNLIKVRELVGEMLLLVWFVLNVGNLGIRVMRVLPK